MVASRWRLKSASDWRGFFKVGPGPTLKNPRQSDNDFNRQRQATILKRGADPADICAAVRYLLEARAVTGQMLAVDGGQHLIWQTPDVQVTE